MVSTNITAALPPRCGTIFLLPQEIDYPSEHLSFELVRKAFVTEYNRRYTEFLEAGKKALILESPYNSIGCKVAN